MNLLRSIEQFNPSKGVIAIVPESLMFSHVDNDPTKTTDLAAAEPDRVHRMIAADSAHPRGRSIHLPFYEFMLDPDNFGGEENRELWADVVTRRSAE